jgi:DNA-binding IclR family transcriptional regulator
MMKPRAPEGAQAVIRAIRLLKELARQESDVPVGELCESLDLTRTTAHRLLSALASEGLVVRSETTGGYRVGPGIVALGARALLRNDLRALVQPDLEKIAEETGEAGSFEILADDRMLILSEASGRFLLTASVEVGTFWPVHATSTGKAVLAHLPREERRRVLRRPLHRYTENTITSLRALDKELAKVRDLGYATARGELELDTVAAAAALVEPASGRPVGAISIGGPSSRLGGKALTAVGERLRSAAADLSRRFA